MPDNRKRLHQLRTAIDRAAQCYHYGTALLTDEQYDRLLDELKNLCPDDERLTRVGYPVPPGSMLTKFKHTTFCGSLAKCDDEVDLAKWHKKVGGGALVSTLKADGNSLVLYYEDGRLVRAVTRGGDDGVGEDVTANAIRSRGVLTLLPRSLTCAVRGESILPIKSWLQVDPDQDSNPRNLGSGMLRRVEGGGAELLDFLAFDIDPQMEGRDPAALAETVFHSEMAKLAFLKDLGFVVVPHELCDREQTLLYYERVRAGRDRLPYWIDGVVYKVNDLSVYREMGFQHGRPRAHTVMKFPAEDCTTVMTGLLVTMGHTGALIPTAQLEPCRIGGTTVSNALLNNYEEIEELDLAVGDVVRVVKAKDIIPKIIEVVERPAGRQPVPIPAACPFCQAAVGKRALTKKVKGDVGHGGDHEIEYGRVLECKNASCPGRVRAKINTWITKLDIKGVGNGVLDALIAAFKMTTPADLYRVAGNPDALGKLTVGKGKLGASRARAICANVKGKQQLPLNVFLGSLGVPYLGRRRVQLIREAVPGQFDTLIDWRGDKLLEFAAQANIPNIAADIKQGIDAAGPVIDDLLSCVTIAPDAKPISTEGGISFVLTGAMSKPRKDIAALIEARGHTVKDDVSAGVTYLVQASEDSTSSKSKKAARYGTKVITEKQLYDLLK